MSFAQLAIRDQMLRQRMEREWVEQRQEWAREFQKAYERWFEEMQAVFLTNFAYGFWSQQLLTRWMWSLPYYLPGPSETPSLPPGPST